MPDHSFNSLPLHPDLLRNLETLGYTRMSDIQAKSLPALLEGRDVIGQSKTGSGKTAAFGLCLLQKLDVKRFRIQALVLCPTRELADQVANEIRRLSRALHNVKVLTLCGGVPLGPQIGSLEHGAHIIVGTPGRIEDHLRKGSLKLEDVSTLVLDEADRMLEMGFAESLENIIAQVPQERQTLLFSATFPPQIADIASKLMQDPEHISIEETHDASTIQQTFYQVGSEEERMTALRLLLLQHRPPATLVFCTTKRDVDDVTRYLQANNFSALSLHGDMEQRDRDQTLIRFSNNSASILVATDVAARGLDIDALDAVINYQMARDVDTHLHRIGRTGRAGSSGIACSLFSSREAHKVERLNINGEPANTPQNSPHSSLHNTPDELPPLKLLETKPHYPAMVTLQLDGGKKQKVRAGDILGALTSAGEISADQVGKINLTDTAAYIAVTHAASKLALQKLSDGKIKGRIFRVRQLK